jgi:hypothetical protein
VPGKVYNVQPMPPSPEHTDYLEIGPLRIGVEYRKLDPATIEAAYDSDGEVAEIRENSPEGGFTDEGLSFHVESIEDEHEYLRFDAFEDDPHYHYVDREAGTNNVVEFDVVAHGKMIPWVLDCLGTRLRPMLEQAGAQSLAARVTPSLGQEAAKRVADHLQKIGQLATD